MDANDIVLICLVSILFGLLIFVVIFNRLETKRWKRFDYWIKRQEDYGSDIWIDFKKGNIVLDYQNIIVKVSRVLKVEEW